MSEEELIKQAKAGDQNSLIELLNKFKSHLYGFTLTKVKSREVTEDLMQDIYLKLATKISSYKGNNLKSFKSWTMTIMTNMITNYFNKNKRDSKKIKETKQISLGKESHISKFLKEKYEEIGLSFENEKELWLKIISKVHPECEYVIKRKLQGWSYEEIAEFYPFVPKLRNYRDKYLRCMNNLRKTFKIV